MNTYTKLVRWVDANKYCHFAKEGDTIEVSEWENREGFDIYISRSNTNIALTYGELEAIEFLTKAR